MRSNSFKNKEIAKRTSFKKNKYLSWNEKKINLKQLGGADPQEDLCLGSYKEKVWLSEDFKIPSGKVIPKGTWGVYESKLYPSEQKIGEEYQTKTKDSVVFDSKARNPELTIKSTDGLASLANQSWSDLKSFIREEKYFLNFDFEDGDFTKPLKDLLEKQDSFEDGKDNVQKKKMFLRFLNVLKLLEDIPTTLEPPTTLENFIMGINLDDPCYIYNMTDMCRNKENVILQKLSAIEKAYKDIKVFDPEKKKKTIQVGEEYYLKNVWMFNLKERDKIAEEFSKDYMEKSNHWLNWGYKDEVEHRGSLDNSLFKEIIKDTGKAIAQNVVGVISNLVHDGGGDTSENLIIPGPALVFFVHQYISIKLAKKLNLLTSPLMNGKLLDILKNYKENIGEVDRLNSLIYLLENEFLVYRGEIKIKIENKKEKEKIGETWKCEVSVSEERTIYTSYIFEKLHQFNYKYYHLFYQSSLYRGFWEFEIARLVYIMFINFPFSETYNSKSIKSDLTGFIDHASKRMCSDYSNRKYFNYLVGKKSGFNYREHCGKNRQVKDLEEKHTYPIALLSSSIVEYFRDNQSKKEILKKTFETLGLPIDVDYKTGRINFMSIMDIFNEFLDFFTNIKNDYQRKIGFIEYPYPSEEFKTKIKLEAIPDIKKNLLSYQNISKFIITQTLSEDDELHEKTKSDHDVEGYVNEFLSKFNIGRIKEKKKRNIQMGTFLVTHDFI